MHIVVVRNNYNPAAVDASLLLAAYLSSQSIPFTLVDVSDLNGATLHCPVIEGIEADLAVVLGGDGTILHAVRALAGSGAPVLGMNFGRLGFLANSSEDGVVSMVARALAGELIEERRTNLRIDVVCEGDPDPFDDAEDVSALGFRTVSTEKDPDVDNPGAHGVLDASSGVVTDGLKGARSFFALNEVAMTRGALGRIIEFSLDVSEDHIANMRGDGIVVATATGSTAYALSAGGPLVAPSYGGLITVPLAPHTLRARALLTGENDVVRVTLLGSGVGREATLFIDGDLFVFDSPVRRIYVRRGSEPTVLLRNSSETFYSYAAETFF